MSVRARMAASSRSPIGTLPPVSTTATPLSPITKPILAMSPRFSSLIERDFAGMDEHAGRDFLDRQWGESFATIRACAPRRREWRRERRSASACSKSEIILIDHSSARSRRAIAGRLRCSPTARDLLRAQVGGLCASFDRIASAGRSMRTRVRESRTGEKFEVALGAHRRPWRSR